MGISVIFYPISLKEKINNLVKQKVILYWVAFYILLLISLTYSRNQELSWRFLRTMIPLFSFPLAFGLVGGLSKKLLSKIFIIFQSSLLGVLIYNIALTFLNKETQLYDYRGLSFTVSHLRLGYFLLFALFLTYLSFMRNHASSIIAWIFLICFSLGLILFKSVGMIPPLLLGCVLFLKECIAIKSSFSKIFEFIILIVAGIIIFAAVEAGFAFFYFNKRPQANEIAERKVNASGFLHKDTTLWLENGVPALMNIHEESLANAWALRSAYPYEGKDLRGQELRVTMWRYLASCGHWVKDSAALIDLSESDIRAIEKGLTNRLMKNPFRLAGRFYEFFWELRQYRLDGDPRGRSVSTRIELWRASIQVIQDNLRRGVGLGDTRYHLKEMLDVMHSTLSYNLSYGPHSQWLGLLLAGGIPLLSWWLFTLLMPIINLKSKHLNNLIFFTTLMIWCGLWEDIFETQASVSFFSFFYWVLYQECVSDEGLKFGLKQGTKA